MTIWIPASAQSIEAMRKFGRALRRLSGELSSRRTCRPILHELDDVEWPWGRRYYRDHPILRAAERRYGYNPLIAGAARVLYAPVATPVPTTIGEVLDSSQWTDLGAVVR